MKQNKIRLLSLAFFVLLTAVPVFAQGQSFTDANVDYTFEIPDDRWKMTVKPSVSSPNVEYVFIERNEGHLEVRKLSVAKDAYLTDLVRDEEQKLQFLPGFVAGKEENFGGFLKGTVFNYEFVRAGRPMSGRFYFLKANDNTVYVLRFTGFRDKLKTIRNQTDSIGRTFQLKRSA